LGTNNLDEFLEKRRVMRGNISLVRVLNLLDIDIASAASASPTSAAFC